MARESEQAFRKLKEYEVKKYFNFNTFFINIATMFRNNYSPDEGSVAIFSKFINDIEFIMRYIEDFVDKGKKSIIVFYFFNYLRYIPKDRLRENTNVKMIKDIEMIIRDFIKNKGPNLLTSPEEDLSVYAWNIEDEFPYKALKKTLIIDPRIALVSHIAWDFLLFDSFKGALIESYTGNIFKSNEINKKVYKDINIPFNRLTYYLLGDKYLFKPILLRKKKDEFDSLAKKFRFSLKPQREIERIIIDAGLITKDELRKNFI